MYQLYAIQNEFVSTHLRHLGHFGGGWLFIALISTLKCVSKTKYPFANKKQNERIEETLTFLNATSTKVVQNGAFSFNGNEFVNHIVL